MATDYTLSGVHPIRRVLWALLKQELGWQESDYSLKDGSVRGLIPIITPQQQPELNATGKPYIVYNYAQQPSSVQYWMKEEQATFIVYGITEEQVRRVLNLADQYFSMYDVSADYLNWWIQDHGTAAHKKLHFKWIRVASTIGAGPSEEEAGRQDGVFSLRYTYTDDNLLQQPTDDRFRPPA